MRETFFVYDYGLYFTISLEGKELTISSDDCIKNFNFLNLEPDRFYSPIELIAAVADLINVYDHSDIQIEDVKKSDDIPDIIEEADFFLDVLDLIVVNRCFCEKFANTYKNLAFMLKEHITNTSMLSYQKPKWWRNSCIDHKEYYQNYMKVNFIQRELD